MSPAVHNCIRGVAGNVENAQMRMPRRKPLGEFHPACARQDNVCEQEIDVEGTIVGRGHRGFSLICGVNGRI